MMRVNRRRVADDFAQNFRAAPLRVFQGFQRQNRRAFAEREAVAPRVEWTAGVVESACNESKPEKIISLNVS